MNLGRIKLLIENMISHSRFRLVLSIIASVFLFSLVFSWWSWQKNAQHLLNQAQLQQQQLQDMLNTMPFNAALLNDVDAIMQVIARYPFPPPLQGKVSDVRIVNDHVKAQVNQASAVALWAWFNQLSQQGVLVSQLTLERVDLGLVSGQIVW